MRNLRSGERCSEAARKQRRSAAGDGSCVSSSLGASDLKCERSWSNGGPSAGFGDTLRGRCYSIIGRVSCGARARVAADRGRETIRHELRTVPSVAASFSAADDGDGRPAYASARHDHRRGHAADPAVHDAVDRECPPTSNAAQPLYEDCVDARGDSFFDIRVSCSPRAGSFAAGDRGAC